MKKQKRIRKPPASPYSRTKYGRNSAEKISKRVRETRWKEGEPMKGSLGDTVTIKDGKILVEKKEAGS